MSTRYSIDLVFNAKGVDRATGKVRGLGSASSRAGKSVSGLSKAVAGIGTAAAVAGMAKFAQSVVQTGMAFEQLRAQLETVTGSRGAATLAFQQIKDFAKSTPFEVDKITASFIRLKAVGIDPTLELLTRAGDVAAANGQDILAFSEAIVGAVTGEMERLKQFGIVARQQGDEVTFIFKGVEKTVKKNSEEIVNALMEIGKQFEGGMVRQAQTLAGSVSNLGDAWDALGDSMFQAGIGEQLRDAALGATAWLEVVTPLATDATNELAEAMEGLHDAVLRNLEDGLASPLFRVAMERVLSTFLGLPLGLSKVTEWLKDLQDLTVKSGEEIREEMDALAGKGDWLSNHLDQMDRDRERSARERARVVVEALKEETAALEDMAEALSQVIDELDQIPDPFSAAAAFEIPIRQSHASAFAGGVPRMEVVEATLEVISRDFRTEFEKRIADLGAYIKAEWQPALADALGGALHSILRGGDISDALSGAGGMLGGEFGGAAGTILSGGNPFAAMLGEELGAFLGEELFGAIGEMFEDTAQGFANAATHAEGVQRDITSGDLGGKAGAVADAIQANFNDVLDSLGGTVTSFVDFGILFREDSKGLRVAIEGIWTTFGDDVQGAIEFVTAELLARADIIGVDPEVAAILADAAGKGLDQIGAEIDAALRVAAGRMGQDVFNYREQVRAIFADFSTIFEAGGDATAGTLGRLRAMWDVAAGQQKSAEQVFKGRKRIILAEIDLEIARLTAEQAALQAKAGQVQTGIDLDRAELMAGHEFLKGQGAIVQATADFAGQLVAIANLIAELGILRGEISTTQYRPPSVPSFGGIPGLTAGQKEAIEREIALQEARAAGNEALAEAIQREIEIARLREQQWTEEQIQRYLDANDAIEAQVEAERLAAEAAEAAAEAAAEVAEALAEVQARFEAITSTLAGLGVIWARGALLVTQYGDAMTELVEAIRDGTITQEQAYAAIVQMQAEAALSAGDAILGMLDRYYDDVEGREAFRAQLEEMRFNIEMANLQVQIDALFAIGMLSAAQRDEYQEWLAWMRENMPDFTATGAAGGGAGGSVKDPLKGARDFLKKLADMQLAATGDPIAQANAEFDELLDTAATMGSEFRRLGTNLGDVTDIIEDLRAARLDEIVREASANLLAFYNDLTKGPASGKTALAQAGAATTEFNRLLALAEGGDLAARDELARSGSDLLNLVSGNLGHVATAQLRQQLIAAIGPGGVLGDLADPLTASKASESITVPITRAMDASARMRAQEAHELLVATYDVRDAVLAGTGQPAAGGR